MKTEQNTTLIVGGSGKTGKRVAARLGRLGRPTRLRLAAWPGALRLGRA